MRTIQAKTIVDAVASLCKEANTNLPPDVVLAVKRAAKREVSSLGRKVLKAILENAEIASAESLAICQDCGVANFFVNMGVDVRIEGMNLQEAIAEGTRIGYVNNHLRKSVVSDPFTRRNTSDNTPPFVHCHHVDGDRIHIRFMPKGAGCDNVSTVRMLNPSDGPDELKRSVLSVVHQAGAKPCPPVTVGIGVGGTIDTVAGLAKKALFRQIGTTHPSQLYRKLESELLNEINALGIGPLGFGGKVTALAVFIESGPCHIASLPLAVNLQCHAYRRAEVVI